MAKSAVAHFKGYTSAKSPFEVSPEFLVKAQNVLLENGQIQKRKPFTKTIDLPSGGSQFPYLWFDYFNYSQYIWMIFIKAATNKIVLYEDAVGTNTEISPPSSRVAIANNEMKSVLSPGYDQEKWLFEGQSEVLKVRQSGQCYSVGLPEAILSSAVATVGTGLWALGTYTYQYVITWVRTESDGSKTESNGSFATVQSVAVNTATHDYVTVTRSGSYPTDQGITHWRVYRRIQSVGGNYFRISSTDIAIGTSTFQDTGIAGSTQLWAPTTHDQPVDDLAFSAKYSGRIWACPEESEYLYFSELNGYDYWPADNFFKVSSKEDPFVGLVPYESFLLIVKRFSMWIIEGSNIINFRLRKLADFGSNHYQSVVKLNNEIIFANDSGIWRWDFTNPPVRISQLIQLDYESMLEGNSIICMLEPTRKHIWIAAKGDDEIFVYDPELGMFIGKVTNPTGNIHHFCSYSKSDDKQELVLIGESEPLDVYHYNSGETGTAETTFDVQWFLGGNWENSLTTNKSFCYGKLFEAGSGNTESYSLLYATDGDTAFTSAVTNWTDTFNSRKVTVRNLGLAGYCLCLGTTISDSVVAADWIIGGIEVELETLGFW